MVRRALGADAVDMFESGIGPGKRSDRFGTWALATFVILFLPLFGFGAFFTPLAFIAAGICLVATLGALACGFVGLASSEREQRRAAFQGLLKASPSVLIGGWYALFLWALMYGDWNLG